MQPNKRLIDKFLTDKMHISVEDCDRLLTDFGYELHKGAGSHRVYHKNGVDSITIVAPKGTKYIKSFYIILIIKYLKLEG